MDDADWSEFWTFRLFSMLIGFGTVVIPTILFVRYVRRKSEISGLPNTSLWSFSRNFAIGRPEYQPLSSDLESGQSSDAQLSKAILHDCSYLFLYFLGIQLTMIPMGYFQERIMTQGYISFSNRSRVDKFGEAQFLVFMNRIFALFFSATILYSRWRREPVHVPPFYKHSYTSLSNTLSSWCQYEALKYVSFPTQTVCKASKILPTMVMGFFVRGKRYPTAQCVSALFLAIGTSIFFLENRRHSVAEGRATSAAGLILMAGYLLFDGFTSNWQKKLFDSNPKVSEFQMMFGVNMFSSVLCFVSLVVEGKLLSSIDFLLFYEDFARDVFLLSLSGALGQIVIYMILSRFGPNVFAIIMTVRQILSIANSMYVYGHPATPFGVFGLLVAFIAIFYISYIKYYSKVEKE